MRAITKEALDSLNLKTTEMEFASEMVIKAIKKKLKTKELPIDYYVRRGESKLRSFAECRRHLRVYAPIQPTFFIPISWCNAFYTWAGFYGLVIFERSGYFGITFYYHPMFLSSLLMMLGYQMIFFSLFGRPTPSLI